LHNNLAGGLKVSNTEIKEIFNKFGWREDIRAQDLSVADWILLTKALDH
jgi:16S rRNA A1518/A1519 N6-dimethyltransferase RsmA/KsgA/DIM1 with predicted DNA glycosylase/AP lyase activity